MAFNFRASPYPKNSDPFFDIVAIISAIASPRLRDVDPVIDEIRGGFFENFSSQSSASGAWPALKDRTVKERIRHGFGGHSPMLFRRGTYYQTFINPGNSDNVTDLRASASGWTLEMGSNDYRASTHEFGRYPIPARSVTDLTGPQLGRIGQAIEEMILNIERQVGNA